MQNHSQHHQHAILSPAYSSDHGAGGESPENTNANGTSNGSGINCGTNGTGGGNNSNCNTYSPSNYAHLFSAHFSAESVRRWLIRNRWVSANDIIGSMFLFILLHLCPPFNYFTLLISSLFLHLFLDWARKIDFVQGLSHYFSMFPLISNSLKTYGLLGFQ